MDMRTLDFRVILLVAFGLGALAALPGAAGEKAPDAAKIAKLVTQLGSLSYEEREQATQELDAIGAPALDALRDAIKGDDLEVRRRSEELIERIEKRVESDRALAPTRLHLTCTDTPVSDAVAELAKKSAYPITLFDPTNTLHNRKVTLDTGETTFWEALDQLCRKAGLSEESYVSLRLDANIAHALPPQFLPAVPPQPAVQPRQRGVVSAVPQAETLVLVDRKPKDLPTCYVGAARFRALTDPEHPSVPMSDALAVPLQITLEPRIAWQRLVSFRIDKVLDDQEQTLAQLAEEPPQPALGRARPNAIRAGQALPRPGTGIGFYERQQVILARLQKGAKETRLLRELQGVITAEVRTPPEPLITVENILQATGKTVEGAKGGFIKVLDASKNAQGDVQLRLELDYPPGVVPHDPVGLGARLQALQAQALPIPAVPNGPGGIGVAQLQLQLAPQAGPGALTVVHQVGLDGLSLLDEKGKKLEPSGLRQSFRAGPGGLTCEYTLTYRHRQGQPEPARLVLSGSRLVMVDMPFTFKNVGW
jgi:hypothetical protein